MNPVFARIVPAVSCLLLGAPAFADGAALYEENCSACHGEQGEGNIDLAAPVLAGYAASYVTRQAAQFRDGARNGEDEMGMIEGMVDIMAELSDQNIEAISTYVASLSVPALEQETQPIGFRDRGLYSGCSSCHEANGGGNEALGAPRLTGQYDWYLKSQLMAFRAGERGADPEDKLGHQMKMMADAIASEADIDVLVNYVVSFDQN